MAKNFRLFLLLVFSILLVKKFRGLTEMEKQGTLVGYKKTENGFMQVFESPSYWYKTDDGKVVLVEKGQFHYGTDINSPYFSAIENQSSAKSNMPEGVTRIEEPANKPAESASPAKDQAE